MKTISAICVCSVTPVIAKETINELSTYPVSIKKSNFEPYVCPVSTKEPDFELPFCPISVTEMSVGHVLVSNPVYKLSFCSASVSEPIDVLLFLCSLPRSLRPGPPSLPLFCLHSTALLDCIGKPFLGEGAMSRILSMHFRSLTTRGHPLTT